MGSSENYIYKIFVKGKAFNFEGSSFSFYNNSIMLSSDIKINTRKIWRKAFIDVFNFVQSKSPEWIITQIYVSFKCIANIKMPLDYGGNA